MPAFRYILAALLALPVSPLPAAEPPRPNFIVILADDLGWADVGFHGGKVPTPHLNRLAREGVEFLQHYVYAVCSPTRAALLSGRLATRFGVTTPQNQRAFPWKTETLASALRSRGYDTALIGKWHLGSRPEEGPHKFGFDHGYGSLAGGVGPWDHRYKLGEHSVTWHRHGALVEEEGHVTDLLAGEAVRWLAARGERPFFLYLPFTAVHIPIREPEEWMRRVPAEITAPSRREFAACVMHFDDAVGQVLAALEKSGKDRDTLVLFTSDNGGYPTARNDDDKYPADQYAAGPAGGDNRPLRGMKTTVYEGGIRVPTVVRWPGRLAPGRRDAPVQVSDWMPTFCALAGYKGGGELRWDGHDLGPMLLENAPAPQRAIYLAAPGFRAQAVRAGDWKLIVHRGGAGKKGELGPETKVELFDLARDPSETTDLATQQPERVAALRAKLADVSKADRDAVAKD